MEMGLIGAPEPVPFGMKMVAPVLMAYGNDEQKQRFLPDILQSNVWWCQGYSEPKFRFRPRLAQDIRRA